MKIRALIAALVLTAPAFAADVPWQKSVEEWRARVEKSLRADNGWLTLAGRYVLKPGANTFGTGEGNDIVFPTGLGPARMGTVFVQPGTVTVKLAGEWASPFGYTSTVAPPPTFRPSMPFTSETSIPSVPP